LLYEVVVNAPESKAALPEAKFGVLITLAWPIVLARATQAVIGFTDALLVAPLGEAALASVMTGAMNTFTALMLPMGTVFILQSFAAQLRGRGDLGAVRRYAGYGLAIAALSGVGAALLIPAVPWLVSLLGLAPVVEQEMTTYVAIRLLSVAPVIGMEALGNWFGGLGNTRASMRAGVITMISNGALAWLVIGPHWGLPGFGVEGAAWATVGACWLGFLTIGWDFIRSKGVLLPPVPWQFKWPELWRVLRFGIPNGFNWFLEFAAFVWFIDVGVGHLGTSVLAAFNVVMQINHISFMPAFGLASAGAILVGETLGAKEPRRVPRIVLLTGLTNAAWMMSVGLSYLIAPEALMGWFVSDGERELLEAGVVMLQMAAIWQLFDAAIMTVGEALRAAGDTTWCMVARIVIAWGLFTPASWYAVHELGAGVSTMMLLLIASISSASPR
jgi:multidrug resistance protein, MATE family